MPITPGRADFFLGPFRSERAKAVPHIKDGIKSLWGNPDLPIGRAEEFGDMNEIS